MATALKQWMFHMEYPHSRHEWVTELSQMMHDHFFWATVGMVGMVACVVLFVGLLLWARSLGTPTMQTPMLTPPHWPMP